MMTNINKDNLQIFFHVVFSRCTSYIPCRSFLEKGTSDRKPPGNIWIEADDNMAINGFEFANLTNKAKTAFYVIPGTVSKKGQAGSANIQQMQTLLIDIDSGDTEVKLGILSIALGVPTMIVESGGIIEESKKKLHVYWQLTKVAEGKELQQLLQLRYQIALSVGGDTHFKSAHQPIRVAGSTYHKGGVDRLVKIRSYEPIEYDLKELIECFKDLPKVDTDTKDNESMELSNISSTSTSYRSSVLPFKKVITTKVHEGGVGEQTRFNHLQRIVGFWLRRYHDGIISKDQAWEEIYAYNTANVVPAWPEDRLKQLVDGLWTKHVKECGAVKNAEKKISQISSYSLKSLLDDSSQLPEDIIAPRILTPNGMFVFGGAPKVGKSDFLLTLFAHMAAGKEFIGFKPPKPLKIFYFQAEIGYHYLRERLQNMKLSKEIIELAQDNLYITPNSRLLLDETGVKIVSNHVKEIFSDKPDIIAVDPIRNVFDGGRNGAGENDNDAMLFFLQKRIELLRDQINPDAGIVLVHHTKKLTNKQFEEEPFAAFSGASSLRGYYTTGAILRRSETNNSERELLFELRNGCEIPVKILSKKKGKWVEKNSLNRPVINNHKAVKLNNERDRRDQAILDSLAEESAKNRAYTIGAFCEAFDGERGLGSSDSIRDRIKVLMRKGYIKFFKNITQYGFDKCTSKYGLMCFEGMELVTKDGEICRVLPTHYKHHELNDFFPVENPSVWVVYGEKHL